MKGSKKDSKWMEVRCFCFIFSWSERERDVGLSGYNFTTQMLVTS